MGRAGARRRHCRRCRPGVSLLRPGLAVMVGHVTTSVPISRSFILFPCLVFCEILSYAQVGSRCPDPTNWIQ